MALGGCDKGGGDFATEQRIIYSDGFTTKTPR
jgi:hypothetical protein